MPVRKVLARDLLIEVLTAAPSTYVQIKGLNEIDFAWETNRADVTDFEDNGNLAHLVASRGQTMTLRGFRMEDESGGDRDPGQAKCEAIGDLIGNDATGTFRLTSQGGEVWVYNGSVQVTPNGGGNDDAGAWECEIVRSGVTQKTPAP